MVVAAVVVVEVEEVFITVVVILLLGVLGVPVWGVSSVSPALILPQPQLFECPPLIGQGWGWGWGIGPENPVLWVRDPS